MNNIFVQNKKLILSFRDMTSLKITNYFSLMIMDYIVTVDIKIVIGRIPCDHKKRFFSLNEVIFFS